MNIVERPDDIVKMDFLDVMRETCDEWEKYTQRAVVDQIDSGLKD